MCEGVLGPSLAGSSAAFVRGQAPPTMADCQANIGISCYGPTQLQTAYDLKALYAKGLTGKGKTIVIVDSFGSPAIAQDVHQFDSDFGLPDPPSLKVIQPAGAVPPFDGTNDDMTGWAFETTLDVEYAHAIAPGANILLVRRAALHARARRSLGRPRRSALHRDRGGRGVALAVARHELSGGAAGRARRDCRPGP